MVARRGRGGDRRRAAAGIKIRSAKSRHHHFTFDKVAEALCFFNPNRHFAMTAVLTYRSQTTRLGPSQAYRLNSRSQGNATSVRPTYPYTRGKNCIRQPLYSQVCYTERW